jgi:hypothetical protein
MLSPATDPRKQLQDSLDFSWMVQHSLDEGRRSIDLARLKELGERVWPQGGGEEILRLVEQVKRAGVVDLSSLIREP